ncbi:MAG: fused MFS/spermidine synthase [Candidatus Delongbacteria bacterium]
MKNRQTVIFITLSIILFFSGAYSLIYQIAWVRFLTLLLGSTTMGITTVVASFMSGLALGSWLASKYLINKKRPLKVYALLELIIAVSAFISPLLFRWEFSTLPVILQKIGDANMSIVILRVLFSATIMLVPTICMGAALPVIGKYLQKYSNLAERRITIIYGLNTIGACVGCMLSGYVLLRHIGLINTIYVTASANALLPIVILLLLKYSERAEKDYKPAKHNKKQRSEQKTAVPQVFLTPVSRNMILVVGTIVGFAGLSSELIWTRLIVLTVGGSIYAYSTILAVYLFFYGVGAAVGGASLKLISRKAGKRVFEISRSVYFTIVMLIPVAITASIAVANFLPDFYIRNFSIERSSSASGIFVNQLLPAVLLMSLPTLLLGLFFSYALYMMKQGTDKPASNTSYLYAWNTVGAIAGSVTVAFWLIPYLGMDHALRYTSTIIIAGGLLSAFLMSAKKLLIIKITGVLSLGIVWFVIPEIDKMAITSGAGIYTDKFQKDEKIKEEGVASITGKVLEMLYYKDGFTATINVTRFRGTNKLSIKTNGKPDGSSHGDMPTQKLSGHFPALFHPDPRSACVIGYGTGTTIGSLAMHPDIEVDAIEIEPAMVEGAKLLSAYNNRPLERENVELHLTDGRLHLQRSFGKYDLIISEPSNPWLSGVSDLFTEDFYELASDAMTPDGVFGQWIQMYSLRPEGLQLVLRSFQEVFPNTYVIILKPGIDLMMIGCKSDKIPDFENMKKRITHPEIAKDIAGPEVNVKSIYDLFSRLVFGPEQTRGFAGDGPVNTDIRPILSYMAPLSLFDYQANIENIKRIAKYWAQNTKIMEWDLTKEEADKLKKAQIDFLRASF